MKRSRLTRGTTTRRRSPRGFSEPKCRYESSAEFVSDQGVKLTVVVSSWDIDSVKRFVEEAREVTFEVKAVDEKGRKEHLAELERIGDSTEEEGKPTASALKPSSTDRHIRLTFSVPADTELHFFAYKIAFGPAISLSSTDTFDFPTIGSAFNATAQVTSGSSNVTLGISSGGNSRSGTGKKVTRSISDPGDSGTASVSGTNIGYKLTCEGNVISGTL